MIENELRYSLKKRNGVVETIDDILRKSNM